MSSTGFVHVQPPTNQIGCFLGHETIGGQLTTGNRHKIVDPITDFSMVDAEGDAPVLGDDGFDAAFWEEYAKDCVECQACTRVCPTCHCFYLYDSKQKDYFAKNKIWDSCLRRDYTTVAGGQNPRKILADRSQHRLLHKFVYFLERYGVEMCVGCGRCIEGCAGGTKMREVLKKLNEELKGKKETKTVK